MTMEEGVLPLPGREPPAFSGPRGVHTDQPRGGPRPKTTAEPTPPASRGVLPGGQRNGKPGPEPAITLGNTTNTSLGQAGLPGSVSQVRLRRRPSMPPPAAASPHSPHPRLDGRVTVQTARSSRV